MVDQFTYPSPLGFIQKNPDMGEWMRNVTLTLDDLTRPQGAIVTGEETTAGQQTEIDTINTTLDGLLNSLPVYTVVGGNEDRSFNATTLSQSTGVDVADAGPAQVVLVSEYNDLVTRFNDLQNVV
ncbi:MAG: hypothetical protein V3V74_00380, partial [Nitrosomonadaceae bacterium]